MAATPALMLQGTCSNAGKSLLVAGLCRAFARRGLSVRPFKPQNMSNNAAVAEEGCEIGRAQALQARACGVPPTVAMNPVLLKPESERGAQVVVRGRRLATCSARDYQRLRPELLPVVLESFAELGVVADLILVEGAGSAAEVNLRDGDIANMGFATAAGVPVVLVGDIERGGVIASLVGTAHLLTASERALLRGYLVNKFRGDPGLFANALPLIEAETGLVCLGIVPWFKDAAQLPPEDALELDLRARRRTDAAIRVAVPALPRIANFDDLDPLALEPDVALDLAALDSPLPVDTDIVLIPGSKAVIDDLLALIRSGFAADIVAHVRRGGIVVGLCGGYQMLGTTIHDEFGLEGPPRSVGGLGLLELETRLEPDKTVREVSAVEVASGHRVRGYEIHLGRSEGPARSRPWFRLDGADEGCVGVDGRVYGSYLHGLFAGDAFRAAFLARVRHRPASPLLYEAAVERALDRLAEHLEAAIDLDRLYEIAAARR